MALLEVKNLAVSLPTVGGAHIPVVRGVTFSVPEGGFHCLVGESGCGKSLAAMSLTRLPPADTAMLSGEILFRGDDILKTAPRRLRAMRREGGIANIFQDPVSSLNPVLRVGVQMREASAAAGRRGAAGQAVELLEKVGLSNPEKILRSYPCELSGGMAQRVCIAMAMAQKPALLIADEPTTALDTVTQKMVLDLLAEIRRSEKVAMLFITHNLGLVAGYGDTVSVMYAGQLVEDGPVEEVLRAPAHPYTAGLLAAAPSLRGGTVDDLATIPGRVPPPSEWAASACAFAPRCAKADEQCHRASPPPSQALTHASASCAVARTIRCFHPEQL